MEVTQPTLLCLVIPTLFEQQAFYFVVLQVQSSGLEDTEPNGY
ncbi:12878_t:CDS:2 [Cetraspora pellucida]|uniref:12878_t:CDS:1 n=1 Tax=Cetraspora pellucida TaxID=1433469 RepID=A0A9N9HFT4_9GLOM|nr:12878_t:CDS:2 [Cetraspora pellucida]